MTPGELVDLYKVSQVAEHLVVRSANFLKIGDHLGTKTMCIKSYVHLLLYHAFRLHQPRVYVDLKLTAGKERHVFAARAYQAGALKLVPYSSNILHVVVGGAEKRVSQPHIQLKLRTRMSVTTYTIVFAAAPAPKPDKSIHPLGKELIVPYWLVRSTGVKEQANMHYSTMKWTMSFSAGKEESFDEAVVVPILENSRVLKEGDELFVYKEPASLALAPLPEAAPSGSKRAKATVGKRLYQPKKKAMKR